MNEDFEEYELTRKTLTEISPICEKQRKKFLFFCQ